MWKDKKDVTFLILGGIVGERIEHFYANLELVMLDKRISMEDNNTKISLIDGNVSLERNKYKFVSFFPIGESGVLTLKGFKYDLEKETIHRGQGLAISNELKNDEAFVEVNDGKFLLFLSKDDKE